MQPMSVKHNRRTEDRSIDWRFAAFWLGLIALEGFLIWLLLR